MIYAFVDVKNKKLWGKFSNKDKANAFLRYVKTLKEYTDFALVRLNSNGGVISYEMFTENLTEV